MTVHVEPAYSGYGDIQYCIMYSRGFGRFATYGHAAVIYRIIVCDSLQTMFTQGTPKNCEQILVYLQYFIYTVYI